MKIFQKYLFVLNILLLSGFVNLYANLDSGKGIIVPLQNDITHTHANSGNDLSTQASIITSEAGNNNKLFVELIDFGNHEEDIVHYTKSLSLNNQTSTLYNAELFEFLSSELQKNIQRYNPTGLVSPLKIHVRHQVFRI